MTEEEKDEYREAWKDGYEKGRADGVAQGYADARFRAHLAVDAVAPVIVAKETLAYFRDAITNIVGGRS